MPGPAGGGREPGHRSGAGLRLVRSDELAPPPKAPPSLDELRDAILLAAARPDEVPAPRASGPRAVQDPYPGSADGLDDRPSGMAVTQRPAAERAANRVAGRPASRRPAPGLRGALDGDETERARQLCLNELDRAPRTRSELAALLQRKEVAPDVAEAVLTRLAEVGVIDDAALAESWVALRHRDKGLSRGTLSQELRRKGVDEGTVAEAVSAINPDDELEAARQLIARKQRSTLGLEPQVRVRRLVGLLARKGYPAGVAYQVVRDALAEEDAAYAGLVEED